MLGADALAGSGARAGAPPTHPRRPTRTTGNPPGRRVTGWMMRRPENLADGGRRQFAVIFAGCPEPKTFTTPSKLQDRSSRTMMSTASQSRSSRSKGV